MARFEEVQMRIAESAKRHLEVYNMQVFIEQFTLDRESRFSLTLPEMNVPFQISATASFTYDAFQTGMSLYEETAAEKGSSDVDTSIELDFTINLPVMEGTPDLEALLQEIEVEYPETEPVLVIKEILSSEEPLKEYEITYTYSIEEEDLLDSELVDEIFEELRGVLDLVYKRTKTYINKSWYRGEDDSFKGN